MVLFPFFLSPVKVESKYRRLRSLADHVFELMLFVANRVPVIPYNLMSVEYRSKCWRKKGNWEKTGKELRETEDSEKGQGRWNKMAIAPMAYKGLMLLDFRYGIAEDPLCTNYNRRRQLDWKFQVVLDWWPELVKQNVKSQAYIWNAFIGTQITPLAK